MSGSFRIGRIAGIDIHIHISWLILNAAQSARTQSTLDTTFEGVLVSQMMMTSVVTTLANISLQKFVEEYFLPQGLRLACEPLACRAGWETGQCADARRNSPLIGRQKYSWFQSKEGCLMHLVSEQKRYCVGVKAEGRKQTSPEGRVCSKLSRSYHVATRGDILRWSFLEEEAVLRTSRRRTLYVSRESILFWQFRTAVWMHFIGRRGSLMGAMTCNAFVRRTY